jgi:hypothetical protein
MRRNVATKSSRVKSARGRPRREHEARRQEGANRVLRDTVVVLVGSLRELEAACVKWLEGDSQHSHLDGAAVQALNHLIARTEQENRAWRGTAEKESQHPHPEKLSGFRCQGCDARFLGDRVFDVARKAELALLAAGHRTEIDPADDPFAWMRCPECASSNICHIQEEDEVEAHSIETVTEVAGEMMDDIKSKLSDFGESAKARVECMRLLWSLCATLSRGCELARENDTLHELVREFGREEGGKRWVRWIEEKKIRPPAQL